MDIDRAVAGYQAFLVTLLIGFMGFIWWIAWKLGGPGIYVASFITLAFVVGGATALLTKQKN